MNSKPKKLLRKIIGVVLLGAVFAAVSSPKEVGAYGVDCTRGGERCKVGDSCCTNRHEVSGCLWYNLDKPTCRCGTTCGHPYLDFECCKGGDGECVDEEPPTCDDLRVFAPFEDFTPENPGFENRLAGWNTSSKASAESRGYEGYGPHSGNLMLAARSGHFEDDKGRASYSAERTITGLTPGKTYYASVWAQPGHQHGWGDNKECQTRGYVELKVTTQNGSDKEGAHGGEYWQKLIASFVPGDDGTATIRLSSKKYKKGSWKSGSCWGWGVTGAFDDLMVYFLGPEVSDICPETPNVGLKVSASDDCEVKWMRFSNDEGVSWSGWASYQSDAYPWTMDLDTGTIWAEVKDWKDKESGPMEGCKFKCLAGGSLVSGHVWEDVNGDGVQDAGELPSNQATLYLDSYGGSEITPVDNFSVEVEEGPHAIYIVPNECFCPNKSFYDLRWNRNENPSTGGACRDDPWRGVCSYAWDIPSEVAYADMGEFASGDTKYAYLGIQKAGFTVELPTGPLILDPAQENEETRVVAVSVRKKNNCWDPSDGTINLTAWVTPSGQGVRVVGSPDPSSLIPNGTAEVTLEARKQASYADSYTLHVHGSGVPGCLGTSDDTVIVKVEHIAWLQSEAGDVYGRGGVTSYIPSGSSPFRASFPSGDYFSLGNTAPGVVLGGGVFEWGAGSVSEKDWEIKNYDIGFYSGGNYDYNFGYFKTNLDFDNSCETDGGEMKDGVVGADGISVASCDVIKVNGDLEITNADNFDSQKAAILVAGNVTFKSNFDPSGFYAFIGGGNLEIASRVENVRGLLLVDGVIYDYDLGVDDEGDWEDQVNGLLIRGSATALGSVNSFDLRRTRKGADGQPDTVDDDFEAADYFAFDGELFLELGKILGTPRYTWKESE